MASSFKPLVPLKPTFPPLPHSATPQFTPPIRISWDYSSMPHIHQKPSRNYAIHIDAVIETHEPTLILPRDKKKLSPPKEDNSNSSRKLSSNEGNKVPKSAPLPKFPLHLKELIAQNVGSSVMETICNIGDGLIGAFLDPPVHKPSIDPKIQLSGNFAPVLEVPPRRCLLVEGFLPFELNGVYIRNGPNAATVNSTGGFHVFDGDGMLHAISFKDGNATYCARHVKTSRFMQESRVGRAIVPKFFGGLLGVGGLARVSMAFLRTTVGLLDMSKGCGLANTSVEYFNGSILAMSEEDMPYVMNMTKEGDIKTIRKWRFPNDHNKSNMCAHPKIDESTGEMFAFSFLPFSYFRVSADGIKSPDVVLPYLDVPLIHDFAITKKYAIFPDNQFVMSMRGKMPVIFDKAKVSRLGILPRYASEAAKMKWFDVPDCNCLHYINAWDEGDEVVIITPVLSPAEHFLDIPVTEMECMLTEVRLNTHTGLARKRKICSGSYEFGTFDHRRTGRRSKFVYMSSGKYPEMSSLVKIDVSVRDPKKAIVGRRDYGPRCYGSEPVFIPSSSSSPEEDDRGYLIALVHKEVNGKRSSEVLVMDAHSPCLNVIARVKLPSRVPYGFHGCFVSQEQLDIAKTHDIEEDMQN